jgi:hypothetical protein
MLAIQNWLKQGQYANLKKAFNGLIASHQEAASRYLMEAEADPRRIAEAQAEAAEANKLLLVIQTLDTIRDGKMELPITKITIEQ